MKVKDEWLRANNEECYLLLPFSLNHFIFFLLFSCFFNNTFLILGLSSVYGGVKKVVLVMFELRKWARKNF